MAAILQGYGARPADFAEDSDSEDKLTIRDSHQVRAAHVHPNTRSDLVEETNKKVRIQEIHDCSTRNFDQ